MFRSLSILLISLFVSKVGVSEEKKQIVIGAIGDSLSSGFNSVSSDAPVYQGGDHPEYSWVSGTASGYGFKSHRQRLQEMFPRSTITVFNAATVSRESKDLERQIDRLRSKAKQAKVKFDLVTIDIGGNDLCHAKDDQGSYEQMFDDYEKNLRNAVQLIIHGRDANAANHVAAAEPLLKPDGKVLILEIPDLHNIWRMYFDLKVNNGALPVKYDWARSCGSKWNLGRISSLRICQPLFGKDANDLEDRSKDAEVIARATAFRKHWERLNDLIHKVVREFPQNIVYHPARFPENNVKWDFGWEEVSPIDCFHPSLQGQSKISERAWNSDMFTDWKN